MKLIISIFSLLATTFLSVETFGQDPASLQKREQAHADSIKRINQDMKQLQETRDEFRMDNAKDASKEAKSKAKRVKQVERDASNASDESKKAVKTEKKAQSSRKKANSQARKASDARNKSDRN